MMYQGALSRSESPLASPEPIPKKEEWAIINKYKALEFERMKQQEQMLARQKKQQFRQALDNQLNSRNNAELLEKQQDKLYSQQLAQKAQAQRQREEEEKRQRYIHRKHVDEENVHHFGIKSRSRDGDTGYHLEIGVQSEKEHIEKASHFRRQMMDTLDLQLRQKHEEKEMSKLRNQELQEVHKRVQDSYFRPQNRKMYGQNQKIYDYYQQLQRQRALKEKDLEHKLVEEARERQLRAEQERERKEIDKRIHNKEVVQETLGQQVKELHRKRVEQHYTNPEDVSFKFISNIFEPKYKGYDKAQYQQQLQKQAQEQRLKRQVENHMSPEQYKLNLNQLSKAVLGDFAQQNYLDRSLGAIGEKYQIDRVDREVEDEDVDVIKSRVKNMRGRANMSTIV